MKKITTTLLLLLGSALIVKGDVFIEHTGSLPTAQGTLASAAALVPAAGSLLTVGQTAQSNLIQDSMDFNDHCFDHYEEESMDCGCDDDGTEFFSCGQQAGGASGNTDTVVHTVAQGSVVIPATRVDTVCDCVTSSSEKTCGCFDQNATCTEDFSVCGNICAAEYNCLSSQNSESQRWSQEGHNECAFHEDHSLCHPVSCDCHAIGEHKWEEFCGTDCSCGKGLARDIQKKPEDDIEERINKQIDGTLSKILSEAVERCISSSLKGCIEI